MFCLRNLIPAVFTVFLASTGSVVLAQPGAVPIDITADSLEYLSDQKLMVGEGNVQVRDAGSVLRADYMTVQTETLDVYARGNVFYQRGDDTWEGDE
ncbi:MAG: hypothetical protein ACO3ZG_07045, partial [Kiritimatiellia bacterium]